MTGDFLLDTCAWLDAFIAPQKLKPEVHDLINRQSVFSLADISLLEVARKAEIGDLVLETTIESFYRARGGGCPFSRALRDPAVVHRRRPNPKPIRAALAEGKWAWRKRPAIATWSKIQLRLSVTEP